jgi:predicted outer membrane lipoprotein
LKGFLFLDFPGLELRSNPGLKLANAFGVNGLKLANAFGVNGLN